MKQKFSRCQTSDKEGQGFLRDGTKEMTVQQLRATAKRVCRLWGGRGRMQRQMESLVTPRIKRIKISIWENQGRQTLQGCVLERRGSQRASIGFPQRASLDSQQTPGQCMPVRKPPEPRKEPQEGLEAAVPCPHPGLGGASPRPPEWRTS